MSFIGKRQRKPPNESEPDAKIPATVKSAKKKRKPAREGNDNHRLSLTPEQIESMSELQRSKSIFINRTSELYQLFLTNAKCNLASGNKEDQLQYYPVPVASMTYGAGKTALGKNYLPEMRKWAAGTKIDEDQQAALDKLKEKEDYHSQLQALCAQDTVSVIMTSKPSLDHTLEQILLQLYRCSPTWSKPPLDLNNASLLADLIAFVRQTRAIFIMVDEIGTMENDVNRLREFVVDLHVANARTDHPKQAKPLHFYLCGRVKRDLAIHMDKSPESSSPYKWHSLVLEPLQAKHVGKISQQLDLSLSANNEVNNKAYTHIVEQTAGVPRQIWRVLTASKVLNVQLKSTAHVEACLTELCSVLANHTELQSDLVNLEDYDLTEEYIKMHILSVTRTLIEYHICSRYLPLTLTQVSHDPTRKLYQVNTAPIFTKGLREMIFKQLMKMNPVRTKWFPPDFRADPHELLVLHALYRGIIEHGLAKALAGPDEEVPPLTLYRLLPFLEGNSIIPDQVLPDTPLDQSVPVLPKAFRRDQNKTTKFDKLKKARGSDECSGRVFQTPKATSSADAIIDFPLVSTVEKGVRLVEVQVKARALSKNGVSMKQLAVDCCAKVTLSSNPDKEWTLHILSAEKMKSAVEDLMPKNGVLVLDSSNKSLCWTKRDKTKVPFHIPKGMYLVVLRPDMNQKWLKNTVDEMMVKSDPQPETGKSP